MPTFDEYKEAARRRGSLGLELYMVLTTPVVPPEEMQKHLPDHLAYQAKLETERSLVMAGPISDLAGERIEGAGLIIYRAASLEAARALADGDPMHARGARTYEIRRWLVNEGSTVLSVGYSTGSLQLE